MKTIFLFWLLFVGWLLVSCHKREGETSKTILPQKPSVDIPVRRSTTHILGAHLPKPPGTRECFVDIERGQIYTASTAAAHAAEIDFCWTTGTSFEGLFSLDAPELGFQNNRAGLLQNRTLLARTERISAADFESVKTTTQLLRLWNRDKPMNTSAPFTASPADLKVVYLFETAQQKRGLLRFIKTGVGPSGDATLQAITEP
jgi:hypothetical protein